MRKSLPGFTSSRIQCFYHRTVLKLVSLNPVGHMREGCMQICLIGHLQKIPLLATTTSATPPTEPYITPGSKDRKAFHKFCSSVYTCSRRYRLAPGLGRGKMAPPEPAAARWRETGLASGSSAVKRPGGSGSAARCQKVRPGLGAGTCQAYQD